MKLRERIDETADQPWTGDTIDLRSRPRHPARRLAAVVHRALAEARKAGGKPAFYSVDQIARIEATIAQRCRGVLADFMAVDAGDDNRPGRAEFAMPYVEGVGATPNATANQARRGLEGRLAAYVDDQRTGGGTQRCDELSGGNGGG